MDALRKIIIIARFEIKTLLRSWFFRIFAFIGVGIITIFNITILLADGPRWAMRAVSSVIPYTNLIMLNVAQSIIIAFLATEFMKRDKKLDTTEVIYIRSMSNGVYILGKTVGTLIIFTLLNVLILSVSATINLLMDGIDFNLMSYFIYPLLMSLPTLVFILGLSYVVMLLIKNQAVTFVILLGYIGSCLFYLQDSYYQAFDYMSFYLPMMYSDMVGFADIQTVLMQRSIYLFLGIGLIFLTILLIGRLRQSRAMTTSSIALSIIFLALGGALMVTYISSGMNDLSKRNDYRAIEAEYVDQPNLQIDSYDLNVAHKGNRMEVQAKMVASSPASRLDKMYFILNPGLVISAISIEGKTVEWERKGQVVEINQAVEQGETSNIEFTYSGDLDQNAMYLDIDEDTRMTPYRVTVYAVGTKYGFIQPEYVLLTQEAKWYPSTRIAYNTEKGVTNPQQYADFQLKVSTTEGMLAISQGKRETVGDGTFIFRPEMKLPQISLVIGNYVERSITIDSVEYRLAMDADHLYFDKYFENVADTLEHTIREIRNDFEVQLELTYPYKRFSIVEVPAQFVSFPRSYTVAKEVMQPEMSFLPEKGFSMANADFQWRKEQQEKRNKERGGELSDTEIEARLVRQFITSTITVSNQNNFFTSDGGDIYTDSYSVFPSYYSFSNFVDSKEWPFFNKAFESYLYSRVNTRNSFRWNTATSEEEDAHIALKEKTFDEILQSGDNDLINTVISVKGEAIFKAIQADLGPTEFGAALSKMVEENKYQTISLDDLEKAFYKSSEGKIAQAIKKSLTDKSQPGYLFTNPELVSFKDNNRVKYLVSFKVGNTQNAAGIIEFSFRMGGRNGGGRGAGGDGFPGGFGGQRGGNTNTITRLVKMEAGKSKQIDIILDEEPRMMMANTFISQNLPATLNFPFSEAQESDKSFVERIVLLDESIEMKLPNEIVVDNTDSGFSTSKGKEVTPLRALILGEQLDEEVKYVAMRWRAPEAWTPTISAWSYGQEIRSAFFISTGEGDEKASWSTTVTDAGYYDIYAYIDTRLRIGRRDQEIVESYEYTIFSDEGETTTTVELKNAENGWNDLGSYYISPGETKVVLSNKSEGRAVVADAIKWVQR